MLSSYLLYYLPTHEATGTSHPITVYRSLSSLARRGDCNRVDRVATVMMDGKALSMCVF